ncbi:MAG: hypothetical protein IJH92_06835 [Mogibacterium sp.]|nr:hypothetical protein [Mogibacterium sp.]
MDSIDIKIDPFTRTPGVAGAAFIDMHYADEIVTNFESDLSSKYVYKIVGLRGSGKSVEYGKIINAISQKSNWLVYTLSAAGNPTTALISKLSRESFIDEKVHETSISAGGSAEIGIPLVKGAADATVTRTSQLNPMYYSEEAVLGEMLQKANDSGKKVLVGIDDIASTPEMVKFLSLWGSLLLEEKREIYFVCTGLYQNIEDFSKERNLTFFKRSDLIEIKALDLFSVSAMYQTLLGIKEDEAVRMAKFTKGYAYAYQVLGSLYFSQPEPKSIDRLIPDFDKILFRDSYELIWNTLTHAEKDMVRNIVSTSGKTSDIKKRMKAPNSYSSLRSRLESKHLINTDTYGYISIDLPRFERFVKLWHWDDKASHE